MKLHQFILVFVILIYGIYFINAIQVVNGNIEVDTRINPDNVYVNEEISITLFIKNDKNTTEVESIRIISPWETMNVTERLALSPNQIYTKGLNLLVPESAKAGKYDISIIVKANGTDYISHANMTVQRLQGIPFSGEIPLSVLAMVLPGMLTYFVAVYILTRKFDRSYIEMGIASVGLGIIAWSIVNLFTTRTIYTILQSKTEDYFLVFAVAIALGFAIVFIIKATQYIIMKLDELKSVRRFNAAVTLKGYVTSEKPAWVLFLDSHRSIAREFGIIYTFKVLVFTESSMKVGLFEHHELNAPYSLSLAPKFILRCSKTDLLRTLTNESSPLKEKLKVNKRLREKTSTFLNEGFIPDNYIFERLKLRLQASTTLESLETILNSIDFSITVYATSQKLLRGGIGSLSQEYENSQFIVGETIKRVEILAYETQYSLIIEDQGETIQVPKTRLFQE